MHTPTPDELKALGMNIQIVNPGDLTAHPENYLQHPEAQRNQLASSLNAKWQQYKNIVVNHGVIVCGHGLVEAAIQEGREKIVVNDVSVFGLSDDEVRALLISDNATPFLALPDPAKLQEIMDALPPLSELPIPGVTDGWLNSIQVMQTEDIDIDQFFVSAPESEPKKPSDKITCPNCGEIFEI